jgi:hypothetical protein
VYEVKNSLKKRAVSCRLLYLVRKDRTEGLKGANNDVLCIYIGPLVLQKHVLLLAHLRPRFCWYFKIRVPCKQGTKNIILLLLPLMWILGR